MTGQANTEYWQRGPVAGIPPLLQPVAHALLQSRDEILTPQQPEDLQGEGRSGGRLADCFKRYNDQIDKVLQQISATPESSLAEPRGDFTGALAGRQPL